MRGGGILLIRGFDAGCFLNDLRGLECKALLLIWLQWSGDDVDGAAALRA
jgi:hypothetical protein